MLSHQLDHIRHQELRLRGPLVGVFVSIDVGQSLQLATHLINAGGSFQNLSHISSDDGSAD